jgi:LysM repeat protein
MHVTVGAETLYSIAQKEGVLLSSLLTLNPGINKDSVLQVGQKIELRAAEKISTKKTKKVKKK